jgi:hypothetical protein
MKKHKEDEDDLPEDETGCAVDGDRLDVKLREKIHGRCIQDMDKEEGQSPDTRNAMEEIAPLRSTPSIAQTPRKIGLEKPFQHTQSSDENIPAEQPFLSYHEKTRGMLDYLPRI